MLVKFSCGCIGFLPTHTDEAWIIRACDTDWHDNEYGLFLRTHMGLSDTIAPKTFEPLSEEEEKKHLEALSRLIAEGYCFRTLKSIMGIKSE